MNLAPIVVPELLANKAIKLTGKALVRYPRSLLQPLGFLPLIIPERN